MEKQKMNFSMMLTERDYFVLMGLYENVVMSFPQIARMHFAGKAKPTILNRLSKLESSGLICKFKVPRLLTSGSENVISVVYQITRQGIRELQKRNLDLELWPEPMRLQPFSIDHDLLLVDVLEALRNQNPVMKFMHGDHFSKKSTSSMLKPDAVLLVPSYPKPVALELELTAKSEKRYRELILKYRLAKDFDHVLYVTSHAQIEAKIRAVLGHSDQTGRFMFMRVQDIFQSKGGQFTNNLQALGLERKVR
jgi:hypothetical protein